MKPPISKKAIIIIQSNRQTQNVEKGLREWLASHAGPHRDAARKALAPTGLYQKYTGHNLVITITRPTCNQYQRAHVYSAAYRTNDKDRNYLAYASLLTQSKETQGKTLFTITTHDPGNWQENPPPWYDQKENLQPDAIAREIIQKIPQTNLDLKLPDNQEDEPITFAQIARTANSQSAALLLTSAGAQDENLSAVVDDTRATMPVILISPQNQLELCSEIPEDKLRQWTNAKAIIIQEPDPLQTIRFHESPEDLEQHINQIRDTMKDQLALFAMQMTMQAMEAMAYEQYSYDPITDVIDKATGQIAIASAMNRSLEGYDPLNAEDPIPHLLAQVRPNQKAELQTSPTTRQRIATLEDQLNEEKERNQELQTQLNAYQEPGNWPTKQEEESKEDQNQDDAKPADRETQVLEAVTDPQQLTNLTFMPNTTKTLAEYSMKRPTGPEIINALTAIDQLAEKYYQSETAKIGSWTNHLKIPGWTYTNAESETTMGQYGDCRRFLDQSRNERIEVQRHMTYRGSSGSLQIYFDQDPDQPKFLVAYIGTHLPYASHPS